MNNTNYEQKYLKYKEKYVKLKEILYGGVKEPQIGFQQHSGECWNDTISTILLYNHTIGDIVQNIFDNFTLEKIFEIIDINVSSGRIPPCLLPINIEESNIEVYESFILESKDYIKNLYKRYKNESLEIPKLDAEEKPILIPGGLQRQCSFIESLRSVRSIININNINTNKIYNFDIESQKHGGSLYEIESILSIFNYFLINIYIIKIFILMKIILIK